MKNLTNKEIELRGTTPDTIIGNRPEEIELIRKLKSRYITEEELTELKKNERITKAKYISERKEDGKELSVIDLYVDGWIIAYMYVSGHHEPSPAERFQARRNKRKVNK